jgi:hypothetical protein
MKNKDEDENDNIIEHYKDNKLSLSNGNIILLAGIIILILIASYLKYFEDKNPNVNVKIPKLVIGLIMVGTVLGFTGLVMSYIGY